MNKKEKFKKEKGKKHKRKKGAIRIKNEGSGGKSKGCICGGSGPLVSDGGDASRIPGGNLFPMPAHRTALASPDGTPTDGPDQISMDKEGRGRGGPHAHFFLFLSIDWSAQIIFLFSIK